MSLVKYFSHQPLISLLPPTAANAQAATVYQTAKAAGLNTLVAVIDATGMKKMLDSPSFKGTVFAPTDEAFAALLVALNVDAATALKNKALLTAVLNYHIITGDVLTKKKLAPIQSWGTNLDDQEITINKTPFGTLRTYFGAKNAGKDSIVWGGSAKVIKADVKADRAIVQVIDAVMVPVLP